MVEEESDDGCSIAKSADRMQAAKYPDLTNSMETYVDVDLSDS